jgi:hypothetical protein
MLRKRLAS